MQAQVSCVVLYRAAWHRRHDKKEPYKTDEPIEMPFGL